MAIRLAVLGSGSAGNSTCIEGGGARILLDAGFSCREIAGRLRSIGVEPAELEAVVITHEHADHVRGASLFSRTFQVPIYCSRATFRAAGLDRSGVYAHHAVESGRPFEIGEMTVSPFSVPHDAVETLGYVVDCGAVRVGYATDLGHAQDSVRESLRGCDLLMIESNHDVEMLRRGPYPEVVKQRVLGRHGHLDNETAADLACEVSSANTARIVLAHLSRTNNRPELAEQATRRGFERAGRRAPVLHTADQWLPSAWLEAR
jgi:phosphoribosyl 1,2-cyclic phosphodiesterase